VDEFYAALVGEPAYERSVDQSTKNYEGIYTAVFLDAFQHPTQDMIATIGGVPVVPNRRLVSYLTSEVSRRAASISLSLSQLPQSVVPSPDDTYIGRVTGPVTAGSAPSRPNTINDVANYSITQALSGSGFRSADAFHDVASASSFSNTVAQLLVEPLGPTIHTQTGFKISGADILQITVSPGFEANLPRGEFYQLHGGLIEISGQRRSGSIAILFANRFGIRFAGVFAILSGFIGNVSVRDNGVSNINYDPTPGNSRYADFEVEKPRLDALRASVAAAAKYGVLNVGTGAEAERWGDRIRVMKGIDPTLGLYAAYAFDRAGQSAKTASVSQFLESDLGTEFFDTAMLAGKLTGKPFRDRSVAPFVPMLAQGWDLLRIKGIQLDPRLFEAWTRLRPALWTTFAPQDIELVSGLVRDS